MDSAPVGPALGCWNRRGRGRRHLPSGARWLVVGGVIAVAVYLASLPLGLSGAGAPASSAIRSPLEGLSVGQAAFDFTSADGRTELLTDLDGQPIHLADFAGRPLWIVFWATWCVPCQQEAPRILAIFHAHRDQDLAVLAIDLQEPRASVVAYAEAHALDYAIGLDPTAAVRDVYRAAGLPSHFFVDGDGLVRARYVGEMTAELMEQYLAVITGD